MHGYHLGQGFYRLLATLDEDLDGVEGHFRLVVFFPTFVFFFFVRVIFRDGGGGGNKYYNMHIPMISFCKPIINCSKHSTFARLFLLDFFEVRRRSW